MVSLHGYSEDHIKRTAGLSYQIDEASEPILLVEELQDGTERKGDGEEHGGVAAAGCM